MVTASATAKNTLSLLNNMAFSTPSVRLITWAETVPAVNVRPAATWSAALAVKPRRVGGTPAAADSPASAAVKAPAESGTPRVDNLRASVFRADATRHD